MESKVYGNGAFVAIKDYAIHQRNIDEGEMTITFEIQPNGGTQIDGFMAEKYALFLREIGEAVGRFNGVPGPWVIGSSATIKTLE